MLRGIASRHFVEDLLTNIRQDRITASAAALAFYSMLALFPAAIFALSLLPYLPIANLEQAIMDLVGQAMPGQAAGLFEQTIRGVVSNRRGGLLSFGLLFTLWSASSGMYAVMQELDAVHRVRDRRPFWRARAIALLLTLGAMLLVFGALALAIAGGALLGWLERAFGFSSVLLFFFAALRWLVIAFALLVALALVYRFGPDVKQRFALFTPGTVAGAAALALAAFAFKLYVGHFGSYDKTYGSLGAVIVLLMWLFVTGLVLLFGAEIDVLARRSEDARGAPVDGAHAPHPA